jgi:hypothetical protein
MTAVIVRMRTMRAVFYKDRKNKKGVTITRNAFNVYN